MHLNDTYPSSTPQEPSKNHDYEPKIYFEAICSCQHLVKVFKDAIWQFLQSIPDKRAWMANELLMDCWFDEYKEGTMI